MKNSVNIFTIGHNNPNGNHHFSLCAEGVDFQVEETFSDFQLGEGYWMYTSSRNAAMEGGFLPVTVIAPKLRQFQVVGEICVSVITSQKFRLQGM
jgi:hypothetical protein